MFATVFSLLSMTFTFLFPSTPATFAGSKKSHLRMSHGFVIDSHQRVPTCGPGVPSSLARHHLVLVIDKSRNLCWLYVKTAHGFKVRKEYVVATGHPKHPTPLGRFMVGIGFLCPEWNPGSTKARASFVRKFGKRFPRNGVVRGGSPMNALGIYCFELRRPSGRLTHWYLHGNNDPSAVGQYITKGCPMFGNGDVLEMKEKGVAYGTPVYIQK